MEVMDDPKAIKKALIRKQNKRNFILQKMMDAKEQENERAERDQELVEESFARNYAVPGTQGDEMSAKVTQYKNLVTGKRRASRERWNRFAGTGDSGGRGL